MLSNRMWTCPRQGGDHLHHLVLHAGVSSSRSSGRLSGSAIGSRSSVGCATVTTEVILHLGIQLFGSLGLGATSTARLLLALALVVAISRTCSLWCVLLVASLVVLLGGILWLAIPLSVL